MPRAWWFVVGFVVVAGLLGGVLNAQGPFAARPALSYAELLSDFEAGRVESITQWRDRLEVTESDRLVMVLVPPDRDLDADLAQARQAGGVGISLARIPDNWLSIYTPWIPGLILFGAVLIWVTAIIRSRRFTPGPDAGASPRPAA